jgi:outer membrane protein OmpA-like peptidoglycan-associated protein
VKKFLLTYLAIFPICLNAQDPTYMVKPLCENLGQELFGVRIFQNNLYAVSYAQASGVAVSSKANQNKNPNIISYTEIVNINNCETQEAKLFSARHQEVLTINSRFNDGPISGNQSGEFLFFSNNSDLDIWPQMGIFMLANSSNGWSESVSFPLNSKDYSCMHPFYDEQGKRLLFASNMPGGETKYAVYTMPFDGKEFGEIKKIEEISSDGNNIFPSTFENMIYFTSDRSGGLGGMDIYAWDGQNIIRLPEPINSPFDDLAYIHVNELVGFISSNRHSQGKSDQVYFFQLDQPMTLPAGGLAKNFLQLNESFESKLNFFEQSLNESKKNNSFVSQQLIFSAANQTTLESTQLVKNIDEKISSVHESLSELAQEVTALLFNENLELIMKKIEFLDQTKDLIKDIHAARTSEERDAALLLFEEHINKYDPKLKQAINEHLTEIKQAYAKIDEQKALWTENQQIMQELAIASILVEAKSKDASLVSIFEDKHFQMQELGLNLSQVQNPMSISRNTKNLIVAQSDTMTVLFAFDSYFVSQEQIKRLNQLLFVCQAIPGLYLSVDGHADNIGPAKYNMMLSHKRAKSVQDQIIKKGGESEKFQLRSFGIQRPKYPNDKPEGRALNRRVEITLTQKD